MRPASLRRALFFWLLGPLIGLWLVGSLAAIMIVRHITEVHYDEALLDTALSLNIFVRADDGRLTMNASEVEQRALLFDPADEEIFSVIDDSGALIAGSADTPRPPRPGNGGAPVYYEASYRGREMRWLALDTRHSPSGATADERRAQIVVGETRFKRAAAIREAVLYVAAPQLVLGAALAVLIWFGIGRGLHPLQDLQRRLKERSAADLHPIHIGRAPPEIHAVIDELNRLLDRLSSSLRQQSAFIGDAAHQLRTPLAALKASAEYLQRQRGVYDPGHNLNRVVETADRCIRVVNQLLALAQADAAQTGGVDLQVFDVVAMCGEVVAANVDAALAGGIDLGLEVGSSGCVVRSDPTLLREALRNLVDNAIHYTPAGGIVTVRVGSHDSTLRIAVTDNGPGVAPDDRNRIFERFQRGEVADRSGSGLGLPIARLCARALGGDVSYFDPPHGKGAGFAIELPLAP